MAVTEQTLRNAKYTLYYRVNKQNVPVQLPFLLMTIDENDQYWVPRSMFTHLSERNQRFQGAADAVVYLDRNQGLPVGARFASWEYHGV